MGSPHGSVEFWETPKFPYLRLARSPNIPPRAGSCHSPWAMGDQMCLMVVFSHDAQGLHP